MQKHSCHQVQKICITHVTMIIMDIQATKRTFVKKHDEQYLMSGHLTVSFTGKVGF